MSTEAITSIFGFLSITALSINAFFLKSLVDKLGVFDKALAVFAVDFEHVKKSIESVETRLITCERNDATMRDSNHATRNDLGTRIMALEFKINEKETR